MRGGNRKPAISVALLGGGAVVVTFGFASMHFAVIAAGVLAIVTGWLAAAGSTPEPQDRDADSRAPQRRA